MTREPMEQADVDAEVDRILSRGMTDEDLGKFGPLMRSIGPACFDAAEAGALDKAIDFIVHRTLMKIAPSPCVYLVQAWPRGPVKIGYATRLASRIRELQVGSPARLVLRAAIPGGADLEGRLHREHDASRLRGEWFKLTPAIKALLKANEPRLTL